MGDRELSQDWIMKSTEYQPMEFGFLWQQKEVTEGFWGKQWSGFFFKTHMTPGWGIQ